MDIWNRYDIQFVQNLVLNIFQTALGELEFLNYYKSQLKKSLEDILMCLIHV